MKRTSLYTGRFALTGVAAAALWMTAAPDAWALGLGRLAVQSALGESLRAEIDITSMTPEEASNLRVRVATPEAYRTAGVDYNPVLPGTTATLAHRADGRPYLRLTSDRAVQEPFVDVILEINWSTGRLVREYTLLFDPPTRNQAAAPPPATAPVITQAPTLTPPSPSLAAPDVAPTAPARGERRPARPNAAAQVPPTTSDAEAAVKPGPAGDEYRVRAGDTLSKIAGRVQRQGVSLDQMLVSLYRANPQAFVENNMNRLRSGVVLNVPSADTALAVTPAEAREVIQAQSADFGAYRQKLAATVPEAKGEGSSRQAGGKVQTNVEDRKQAAVTTPDKLTLSKGGKASAPEEKLSKEREKKDTASRVAELSKNVEELKKLSGAASLPPAKTPAAPAPEPAPTTTAAAPTKPAVALPMPVAPPPPASASASAPVVAPASAPEPVVAAASKPAEAASQTVAADASAPVVAAAPVPAPKPSPAKPAVPPVEEPSALVSMLDENPWALGIGAAVVALLAIFGIYRFTRRSKKDSGETSFLESRLQPDSFFGASGGQRIDTRDAGGASSSMSYSLSQLDAIGDVDPVAEADVYLAYGRDLQAEEILKEAMRSNPERLAIRTKLLEVYAKRRDTKGFELLATQLFALTRGEGEDWAKAQELGQQIDHENALYQPGGAPVGGTPGGGLPMTEPLGASTMPQSVLPTPSMFEAANARLQHREAQDSGSVDLDLDLDTPAEHVRAPAPLVATKPMPRPHQPAGDSGSLDFDSLPDLPVVSSSTQAPSASSEFPMDFDLSAISLDLSPDAAVAPAGMSARETQDDLSSISFDDADDGADPLARKLELAEEFRQIGDMEGARDLLQEVVAKASGTLKTKAQGMLNELS